MNRKQSILSLCFGVLFVGMVCAQESSVVDKGEAQVKLFKANQTYLRGDLQNALKLYNDVLKDMPGNSRVLFAIGRVYYEMGEIASAVENLEKAQKGGYNNAELHMLLGRSYHSNANLDKALESFQLYKSVKSKGNATANNDLTDSSRFSYENDIDKYIAQVKYAKQAMASPRNVTVLNLGDNVNSSYDDKTPSVTADGKTLIFNSRRPGGKGKVGKKGKKEENIDKEGDFKYFEDVYVSVWDSANKQWAAPELIQGGINTEAHDACTSISPDGKTIFLYKNDAKGARGGDLFFSKAGKTGKWSSPVKLNKPINTSYYEDGACVSADGSTLYFISENPKGGQGQADIWMAKKIDKKNWGEPVNLGPVVNTPEDEGGIFIAPDGKTLFFSSTGHNSMGSYDIFKTVYENGQWSKPVNLGYPINTVNKDVSFTVSADAKTGYFASDRKGGLGERDLYKVDLTNFSVLEKDFKPRSNDPGIAILKGTVFNGDATPLESVISIFDEAGAKVAETTSSEEGDYFITLPAGKTYEVKTKAKGYKETVEKAELKSSRETTYTLVKHFILSK